MQDRTADCWCCCWVLLCRLTRCSASVQRSVLVRAVQLLQTWCCGVAACIRAAQLLAGLLVCAGVRQWLPREQSGCVVGTGRNFKMEKALTFQAVLLPSDANVRPGLVLLVASRPVLPPCDVQALVPVYGVRPQACLPAATPCG